MNLHSMYRNDLHLVVNILDKTKKWHGFPPSFFLLWVLYYTYYSHYYGCHTILYRVYKVCVLINEMPEIDSLCSCTGPTSGLTVMQKPNSTANCNINATLVLEFSTENAEIMKNCPYKTMVFYGFLLKNGRLFCNSRQ